MKKILLMGGTGAMGGYLANLLAASGKWNIWVTSRTARSSGHEHIRYIQGNARDSSFRFKILEEQWDAIVDFMNYDYDEYARCVEQLLSATSHYVWFSSCRVYADSATPLEENSPRLLETSTDSAFLATNRYALRKARQENLLTNSQHNNYTIIRPYITYSEERLQLGIYEKEQWLWRLLKGKGLVINKRILDKKTALTHGMDVATAIARIVGNDAAFSQVIQIATDETASWAEILNLYLDIIESRQGKRPAIYSSDSMKAIDELYEGGYNTIYDRVYNRCFDSSKVEMIIEEPIDYKPMHTGLRQCLESFIDENRSFLSINPQFEAYQDLLLNEELSIKDFDSESLYNEYQRYRHVDIRGLDMKLNLEPFSE